VPQNELKDLLKLLPKKIDESSSSDGTDPNSNCSDCSTSSMPSKQKIDIESLWLDCSVSTCQASPSHLLVQTTDFFYPLIDCPFTQGQIACANVLSDLYSTGITHCDNLLMLLGVCRTLPQEIRSIITKELASGFSSHASLAQSRVSGGQTVFNPWFIIGGVASSVIDRQKFSPPIRAIPGDVIVLTKPLGTQPAVNAYQWMVNARRIKVPLYDLFISFFISITFYSFSLYILFFILIFVLTEEKKKSYTEKPPAIIRWEKALEFLTEEDVFNAFKTSVVSMRRLNKTAAMLMNKYDFHACTDVTGFGLVGHAQNLCESQELSVDFEIHTLPLIPKTKDIVKMSSFKLLEGLSAETSGGLLICLPKENAELFCQEILKEEGFPAWIIGSVKEGFFFLFFFLLFIILLYLLFYSVF